MTRGRHGCGCRGARRGGWSDEPRPHVSAHDPDTWREPRYAMAREFYRWETRS
ncbi:TcmI family type II polyketide cyclase [Actinosynnema sp. NPDC051121]